MIKSQVILGIVSIISGLIVAFSSKKDFVGGTILILIGSSLIIFKNEENKIEKIKEVNKKWLLLTLQIFLGKKSRRF